MDSSISVAGSEQPNESAVVPPMEIDAHLVRLLLAERAHEVRHRILALHGEGEVEPRPHVLGGQLRAEQGLDMVYIDREIG